MKKFLWVFPLVLSLICFSNMIFSLDVGRDIHLEKYELYVAEIECDNVHRKGKYYVSIELEDGSNLTLSKSGICKDDEFQRFVGLRADVLKYGDKIFDLSVDNHRFISLQEKVNQINGIWGFLGLLCFILFVIIYRTGGDQWGQSH